MTVARVACSLMLQRQGRQNAKEDLVGKGDNCCVEWLKRLLPTPLYRRKKNENKIGNYAEQDETEDCDEASKRKEAAGERQTRRSGN